jgi:hypothetical protein
MVQRDETSEYGQELFRQARKINQELAIRTHSDWLERDMGWSWSEEI